MATKDNFVKALKELTGLDEEPSGISNESPFNGENFNAPQRASNQETTENRVMSKVEPPAAPVVETPNFVYDKTDIRSGATKITSSMVVIGDITGTDRIDVMGNVKGDIDTTEDLVVEGTIEGGLKGKNMLLQGSSIKGNVLASGDVAIETGSAILGNVQAANIKLDGKVKGNLFVAEMTQLTSNALLIGDIETTGIATNIGSRIRGNIITKRLDTQDEDDLFDLEV